MLLLPRLAAIATLLAAMHSSIAHSDDTVVCDHSFFGQPNGWVTTEWNIPKEALQSLLQQSRLAPADKKQYFSCPNTFAALTFSPKDGFRFVVIPYTWADFKPKRISHTEMNKRVMNLAEIEALLDTPSVGMGSVSVRISAYCGHGVSGTPLSPDTKTPSDDGG